jgi:hypothetical protein
MALGDVVDGRAEYFDLLARVYLVCVWDGVGDDKLHQYGKVRLRARKSLNIVQHHMHAHMIGFVSGVAKTRWRKRERRVDFKRKGNGHRL